MLRNNADARRRSYFELGLPMVEHNPVFIALNRIKEKRIKDWQSGYVCCLLCKKSNAPSSIPGVTSNPFFDFCPFCVDSNTSKRELWRREGWMNWVHCRPQDCYLDGESFHPGCQRLFMRSFRFRSRPTPKHPAANEKKNLWYQR